MLNTAFNRGSMGGGGGGGGREGWGVKVDLRLVAVSMAPEVEALVLKL